MSTASTPAVPIVVGLDDELLDDTHLLPVAAKVAAIANAGHWYLLRYDPQARELRVNPSPGPDRTPQIVRCRRQVQRKASPGPCSRPRWATPDAALAQQFAALEALALHGLATATHIVRCDTSKPTTAWTSRSASAPACHPPLPARCSLSTAPPMEARA